MRKGRERGHGCGGRGRGPAGCSGRGAGPGGAEGPPGRHRAPSRLRLALGPAAPCSPRTKTFSISAISSSASPLTATAKRSGREGARPSPARPPPRYLESSGRGSAGGAAGPPCPARGRRAGERRFARRFARAAPRPRRTFPKPPRVSRSSMARAAGAASRKRAQGRGGGPAVPVAAGAAMEEFRRGYARLCAAPQEPVLRRLRELGGARGRLDLAAQGLSLETCGALARLLPGAAPVTELALGDCGLSEEGEPARPAAAGGRDGLGRRSGAQWLEKERSRFGRVSSRRSAERGGRCWPETDEPGGCWCRRMRMVTCRIQAPDGRIQRWGFSRAQRENGAASGSSVRFSAQALLSLRTQKTTSCCRSAGSRFPAAAAVYQPCVWSQPCPWAGCLKGGTGRVTPAKSITLLCFVCSGAKLLLHGLCSNTTVKALDLKVSLFKQN